MAKYQDYTEKTSVAEDDLILIADSANSNATKRVKRKNLQSYKKYVATISQQTTSQTSGVLVIGRKYIIAVVEGSDDFLNVGYVSNGVEFTATGTTPDEWSSGTIVVETAASAPAAIVFENTLSGTPIWSYGDTGVYYLTLSGAFPQNKTFILCSGGDSTAPCTFVLSRLNNNALQLVVSEDGARIDGLLTTITPGSVEVRIYP